MSKEIIKTLLDKIEADLGHYSPVGGIECPYIKTDDKGIRESIEKIRAELY